MSRKRSYALSIALAVVPLAILFVANHALYTYAGIGTKRSLYDLVQSDEDLYRSLIDVDLDTGVRIDRSAVQRADGWTGTPGHERNLFIIGGSPSKRDIQVRHARALREERDVVTYNVSMFMTPFPRVYDRLRALVDLVRVDVVVVEHHAYYANDFRVSFGEFCGRGQPWPGTLIDEELRGIRSALRSLEPGLVDREKRGLKGEIADLARAFRVERDRVKLALDEALADPERDGAYTTEVKYVSKRERWAERFGVADITATDSPLLESSRLATATLEKILQLCIERDIRLIVYVPPRAPDISLAEPGSMPRQEAMARASLSNLEYMASLHGFKVFDYDTCFGDTSPFHDSVHLGRAGADRFSAMFFADIAEFLGAEEKDFSYAKKRP